MLGGTTLGLLLALGRVYGNKAIYVLSTGYIELFRGTPMLVQMLFIYFGLPEIGVMLTPVIAASIALGMNTAAYQAEYFRGAIQSIKAGQMVAAHSLGMTKIQVIHYITLPQALRIVIPQWSNESILLLKYSSIAFAIGVPELMARAQMIGYSTFRFFDAFLLAALIYLILTTTLAQLLDTLGKKVRIPGREGQ
jgi:polar amino acid transport system permease protein